MTGTTGAVVYLGDVQLPDAAQHADRQRLEERRVQPGDGQRRQGAGLRAAADGAGGERHAETANMARTLTPERPTWEVRA